MALGATFETVEIKKTTRVLILTKKSGEYGDYGEPGNGEVNFKSGLNNSALFLANQLSDNLNIVTHFATCVDANSIDKEVHNFKPTHVILEAIWITPTKMREIQKLYPKVIFVIRVHSKVTFLAYEGSAVEFLKGLAPITNVYIGFNSLDASNDFRVILNPQKIVWLPNVYKKVEHEKLSLIHQVLNFFKSPRHSDGRYEFHVACFGAIRPMKNMLAQAFAAMIYAEEKQLKLMFHVNTGRVEQKGDGTLKNLEALFKGTKHRLIRHDWLDHNQFLALIKDIDLGMQVSLNESFNVVTADYIYNYKPIVVSEEIDWVAEECKTINTSEAMVRTIDTVLNSRHILKENLKLLHTFNRKSLKEWDRFLSETEW